VGAMASYRGQVPAETLGVSGFDLGASTTATRLKKTDQYSNAISGSSNAISGTVHAHKGLLWGFDIGGYISQGLNSNVHQRGFELRYALLEGGILTPAIGLRLSTTKITNIDNLDLNTTGLDVSISKGFAVLTPYAGVGVSRVKAKAGDLSESVTLNKMFAGVGMNLLLLNMNIEYDKTGDVPSYSAKFGLRF